VIQMIHYRSFNMTAKAHKIAELFSTKRKVEDEAYPFHIRERILLAESIDPHNDYGKFAIYAKETHRLNLGKQVIDLTDVEQLMELSQTNAVGYAIEYAKRFMNKDMSLRDIVHHVTKDIDVHGIDVLSDKISGHFAWFRAIELAFILNRLRGLHLQVIQKDVGEI